MHTYFHSPVIFVKDIEISKRFYSEILDQETEHDFGKNVLFKSRLSLWQVLPEHEIGQVTVSPSKGNTMELYFETLDIQKSYKTIVECGCRMLHELKTESWGQKTFRFFDPDGHLIEIGESLKTFIGRIYRETSSIMETALRTGVDESTIKTLIG